MSAPVTVAGRCVRVAVVPDAVFALRFKETGRCAFFFVEADRSSMPIERGDLSQTSYRRKLIAHQQALKSRQQVEFFGFDTLRLLTVTTRTGPWPQQRTEPIFFCFTA